MCAVGGLLPSSWFIYHPGIVFPRISLQPLCSGLVSDTRKRVFESFTRATICPLKYSCEQVQRSNGVGDDAPKFVTPQRETKNKETNSENDSNLRFSSKDDLNDKMPIFFHPMQMIMILICRLCALQRTLILNC